MGGDPTGSGNRRYPPRGALVYLAGPITGLTKEEAQWGWRRDFTARLHAHITPLSPMRTSSSALIAEHFSEDGRIIQALTNAKSIVEKDKLDIRRADLVVANFLGAGYKSEHPHFGVSIGSVWELGYAHALDKPIVVIMEEDNPHRNIFTTVPALAVVEDLETAAEVVNGLLSEGL